MIARLKRLVANPLVFGAIAGIAVVIFDMALGRFFGGSLEAGYTYFVDNDPLWYLVPVAVGIQMGLLRHYYNIPQKQLVFKSERLEVAGSTFTSVTLVTCCVACCVMPVWSLLPAIGFVLAASSAFMQYRDAILFTALLANVLGSIVLLLLIHRRKKGW